MEEATQHKLKELRIILDSNEVENYFQNQNVKIKEEVYSDDEPTDLQPISQVYLPDYKEEIKSEGVDSSTFAGVEQLGDKHEGTKKLFSCSLCKKNNMSLLSFKQHLIKAHHLSNEEILKYVPEFYQCKYCHRQFKHPSRLRIHEDSHTLPFKCDQCDKSFGLKTTLKKHKLTHSDPQLPCPHCDKKFRYNGDVKVHIERKHSGAIRKYKCDQCEKKFKFRADVKKHINYSHSITQQCSWKCDECSGKCFKSKQILKGHIINVHHTKSKNYLCSYCNKKFKTNDGLKRHIRKKHKIGVPMKSIDSFQKPRNHPKSCNVSNCEGVSKPSGQLLKLQNQHIKEEISGPEIQQISEGYLQDYHEEKIKTEVNSPLESTMTVEQHEDKHEDTKELCMCSLCKKDNMSLASFKPHLTKKHHLNNEEILKNVSDKCEYCQRQFQQKLAKYRHEGSHKCDICDKKFRRKRTLKEHISSKHSDEVHKCDQCEKDYKCRSYLLRHIRNYHNNPHQRFWKCDECGKCFTMKVNLKKHIIYVHLTMSKSCSYCSMKFKSNLSLKRHMKTKHNSGVPMESNDSSQKTRNYPKTCNGPDSEGLSKPVGQLLELQNQHIKEEISKEDVPEIQPISQGYFPEYQEGNIKTEVNSPLDSVLNDTYENDVEIETEITIDEMDRSTIKTEESTEEGHSVSSQNETSAYKQEQVEHLADKHNGTKTLFSCSLCKEERMGLEYFKAHLTIIHHLKSEEISKYIPKFYQCKYCHRQFKAPSILHKHEGSHTLPFSCDICEKRFGRKDNLKTHKLIHSSECQFPCPHCDLKFSQKSTLANHIESIHGGDVHKCDQCEKKYKWRGSLFNHIKKHHTITH